MDLGIILKKFREAHGLSQRGLAKALGVSSAYVSLLEAGKRTPSLDYLEAFASVMGTRVWRLMLAAECEGIGWPVTVGVETSKAL